MIEKGDSDDNLHASFPLTLLKCNTLLALCTDNFLYIILFNSVTRLLYVVLLLYNKAYWVHLTTGLFASREYFSGKNEYRAAGNTWWQPLLSRQVCMADLNDVQN